MANNAKNDATPFVIQVVYAYDKLKEGADRGYHPEKTYNYIATRLKVTRKRVKELIDYAPMLIHIKEQLGEGVSTL